MNPNKTLLLSTGAAGETAARVENRAVTFTRVLVGDGGGSVPSLDVNRTALENEVSSASIVSDTVDTSNPSQRLLILRVGNDRNYFARELMLYAESGGLEFPHTYIVLGDAYPIRTLENGGLTLDIEATIKISSETDFTVHVNPAADSVTHEQLSNTIVPVSEAASIAKVRAEYAVRLALTNQNQLIEMRSDITLSEARQQTVIRLSGSILNIEDVFNGGDLISVDNRIDTQFIIVSELPIEFPDGTTATEIETLRKCRFLLTAKDGGLYFTPLWSE